MSKPEEEEDATSREYGPVGLECIKHENHRRRRNHFHDHPACLTVDGRDKGTGDKVTTVAGLDLLTCENAKREDSEAVPAGLELR